MQERKQELLAKRAAFGSALTCRMEADEEDDKLDKSCLVKMLLLKVSVTSDLVLFPEEQAISFQTGNGLFLEGLHSMH